MRIRVWRLVSFQFIYQLPAILVNKLIICSPAGTLPASGWKPAAPSRSASSGQIRAHGRIWRGTAGTAMGSRRRSLDCYARTGVL